MMMMMMMVMMVMKVNLLDIGKLGRREVGGCKQDTPGGPAPGCHRHHVYDEDDDGEEDDDEEDDDEKGEDEESAQQEDDLSRRNHKRHSRWATMMMMIVQIIIVVLNYGQQLSIHQPLFSLFQTPRQCSHSSSTKDCGINEQESTNDSTLREVVPSPSYSIDAAYHKDYNFDCTMMTDDKGVVMKLNMNKDGF